MRAILAVAERVLTLVGIDGAAQLAAARRLIVAAAYFGLAAAAAYLLDNLSLVALPEWAVAVVGAALQGVDKWARARAS